MTARPCVQEGPCNADTPERDALLADKQHARTMADLSLKALSAKELLGKMLADVSSLQTESATLTQALDASTS
jgi:hypothetical protein